MNRESEPDIPAGIYYIENRHLELENKTSLRVFGLIHIIEHVKYKGTDAGR